MLIQVMLIIVVNSSEAEVSWFLIYLITITNALRATMQMLTLSTDRFQRIQKEAPLEYQSYLVQVTKYQAAQNCKVQPWKCNMEKLCWWQINVTYSITIYTRGLILVQLRKLTYGIMIIEREIIL